MNLNKMLLLACIMLAGIFFHSCNDDEGNGVKTVTTTLNFKAPDDLMNKNPTLTVEKLSLKNVNTGEVIDALAPASKAAASNPSEVSVTVTVPEGLYNVSMEGNLSYTVDGNEVNTKMRSYKDAVTLTQAVANVPAEFDSYVYNPSVDGSGFVLAEIFFTGSETPESKQYNGDKYFRIYNNSGDTLAAAGLTILESEFLTTSKYAYTPDIMKDTFTVYALYRIPLDDTRKVAPGESLLICDVAKDHTADNQNSFDLSKADYEWYDETTNPKFTDTDNPDVPNLERIFSKTLTIWGPHNRGFKAYALAYLGGKDHQLTKEEYIGNMSGTALKPVTNSPYFYSYSYEVTSPGGSIPMSQTAAKVPNSWIIDAVNLSIESNYEWIVTAPSLDKGWTYCGKVDHDASRYGKSVRRKVLSGLTLQDTNDSSVDFDAEQQADPYHKFHE